MGLQHLSRELAGRQKFSHHGTDRALSAIHRDDSTASQNPTRLATEFHDTLMVAFRDPGEVKEISRWRRSPERPEPPGCFVTTIGAPAGARAGFEFYLRSPQVFSLVFHQPALEHRDVLLLEGDASMMFLLTQNVSAHALQIRRTHCKCPVTLLPGKATQSDVLMNPSRGLALEFRHHLSEAMGRAQSGTDMDMISGSTHRMRYAVEAPNNTAKVFVDTSASSWCQPRLAIFCAKHEVIMQRKMRRRHPGTSRALAGAQFRTMVAPVSGGCGRGGDLHHRLMSAVPQGRLGSLAAPNCMQRPNECF